MKIAIVLVILLATSATLLSQERNGSVSGTVIDVRSQAPLSGVIVQIPGIGSAKTNDLGQFRIANIPPGRHILETVRSRMATLREDRSSAAITVGAGEEVRNVRLHMSPFVVIRGHIRDGEGAFLSGVSVQALVLTYVQGRRVFVEPSLAAGILNSSAETDEKGEYQIELPPGNYYVRAQLRPLKVSEEITAHTLDNSQKVYFPGTMDAALATAVALNGEEVSGIDFKLDASAQPTHKIYVRVDGLAKTSRNIIPSGAQIAELRDRFSLERIPILGSAPRIMSSTTPALVIDGVSNGSYDLYMDAVMDGGVRGRGITPIDVRGEDLHDVVVSLRPAQDIAGRVVGADLSGMIVQLGSRTTTVETNGAFVFSAVLPGAYSVTVEGLPSEAYIADIRYGGESLHSTAHNLNGPELEAGIAGTPLQIVVATNGGRLDGVVDGGEAAAGSTVVLVPALSRRFVPSDYRATTVGPSGSFSLKGVPPGVYQLFAWQDVPDTAWLNPDFMSHWEGRGQVVSIEAGSAVTVRTRLN